MKTFRNWFSWLLKGNTHDRAKLDDAVFFTFNTPHGKIVLDYLITEHLMNMSYRPETAQVAIGKHMVVQDLLARMDRALNKQKYEVTVEEEVHGR